MKTLLEQHVGQVVGLNLQRPFHIEAVHLLSVEAEYFSVKAEKDDNTHYIPYANIVRILENEAGVQVGGLFHQKKTYPLVIKIGHIVEYVPP